jgi:hypothetical protein
MWAAESSLIRLAICEQSKARMRRFILFWLFFFVGRPNRSSRVVSATLDAMFSTRTPFFIYFRPTVAWHFSVFCEWMLAWTDQNVSAHRINHLFAEYLIQIVFLQSRIEKVAHESQAHNSQHWAPHDDAMPLWSGMQERNSIAVSSGFPSLAPHILGVADAHSAITV